MKSINDKQRAFTLIELVVAISLLALVILFTGSIFRVAINSYRVAGAQAEVMQKLRAITGQLNSDFKGLRKDAPIFIWFHLDPIDPNKRCDQIMFFADGDFQSTLLYNNKPIVSNVARIQYCQASIYSLTPVARYYDPWEQQGIDDPNRFLNINHRTLARRQHLLTVDENILLADRWPDSANFVNSFIEDIPIGSEILKKNDAFEHDWLSLSQWQALMTVPNNINQAINVCFGYRPKINFVNANGLHMLMTEGVSSFSVQWSYLYTTAGGQTLIYWWPSIDPDGNGNFSDSDFANMATFYSIPTTFAFYFNSAGSSFPNVFSYDKARGLYYPAVNPPYPQALKFTFTLYDSKGVFKDGQTFTHIIYIGD